MKSDKMALGFALLAVAMLCHAHAAPAAGIDIHAIPLGDGKVSSYPEVGDVYSCRSHFRGGGARHVGPWIHGDSWDATQKIHVQGDVPWPEALFQINTSENSRDITGNGLPVSSDTGIFPIQPSDPAYQIDRNPNAIEAQHIRISLPLNPQIADTPSCLPMGMVGVMLNGVALYDAVDDAGRDAVAHEVQDQCNGHPQHRGQYHYHGPSPCVPNIDGKAKLVGYALDGFGIYSMRDENGRELTDKDLDACHGRTSPVMWNGKRVNMYHYVMTREYPYSIGCFMGTPVLASAHAGSPYSRQQMRPGRGNRRGPPPQAIQACADQMPGDACRFTTPRGRMIEGICRSPNGALACVPRRRR